MYSRDGTYMKKKLLDPTEEWGKKMVKSMSECEDCYERLVMAKSYCMGYTPSIEQVRKVVDDTIIKLFSENLT